MARFYGKVGFGVGVTETSSGIWEERIEERNYFGTVLKHERRWEAGTSVEDNLSTSNRISIVADDYAAEHCSGIKYVVWLGALWKVNSFEVAGPRIILNLGGVWNGHSA